MDQTLIEKLLDFSPAGNDKFSCVAQEGGVSRINRLYGGVYTAQSMATALQTVPEGFYLNSLHGQFLNPGAISKNLLYNIERVKDGVTFMSRGVRVVQDQKTLYTCQLSFNNKKYHNSKGYPCHCTLSMPDVPLPIDLEDAKTVLRKALERDLREDQKQMLESRIEYAPTNFQVRPADPEVYLRLKPHEPRLLLWVKANEKLGDDSNHHNILAAYISDSTLVTTAMLPHQKPGFYKAITTSSICSLDHSIWIHHPDFRIDQWMLYEQECPVAESGRALVSGRFWTQDGVLAMSVSQEALIRLRIPQF